jgi:hypothetical protein
MHGKMLLQVIRICILKADLAFLGQIERERGGVLEANPQAKKSWGV